MKNKIIPNNLKHKPMYVIQGYSMVDGIYANKTDVQGISIGRAQWQDEKKFTPSIKVWRYTGKRWSRQSEETTFTRAIDMATFIIRIINVLNCDCDNVVSIDKIQLKIDKMDNDDELKKYINNKDIKKILKSHIDDLLREIKKLKYI